MQNDETTTERKGLTMLVNLKEISYIKENMLKIPHLTTVKSCGNMKDEQQRIKFCQANNINHKEIVFAQQVHGTFVKKVSKQDCGTFIAECDGLITNEKNITLAVFTADCMPVFMTSRDYSVIALVHAGWRGLAGGILESALISFKKDFGILPQDVFTYIGPHISKCCYEVGSDVKKAFDVPESEKYLSLSEQAEKQLRSFGVKRVYVNGNCTCHEEQFFYSYRREQTECRMLSLISAL
ncbi:MAG: peptidoglycan editing factor PgeF [Endomicrobiaceae bacterium]|nr:peptidoglycan editing factor PgeF [Endomicrobiaceae bacterium]